MISLCTVIVNSNVYCLKVLLESVNRYATKIQEICIVDIKPRIDHRIVITELQKILQTNIHIHPVCVSNTRHNGHALGIHWCLHFLHHHDYIMICDPDVFFLRNGFDNYFIDLFVENKLMFLGAEHYKWPMHAFGKFPTVICMVTHYDHIPNSNFLNGEVRCGQLRIGDKHASTKPLSENQWMLPGPVERLYTEFPYADKTFDVGCNLFLWNKIHNGKWMSFESSGNYYNTNVTANFEFIPNSNIEPILYHQGKSSFKYIARLFKTQWQMHLDKQSNDSQA